MQRFIKIQKKLSYQNTPLKNGVLSCKNYLNMYTMFVAQMSSH